MTQSRKANQKSEQTGVTLDDLAMMVKDGFDTVDSRLNNLEQGQVETNKRLVSLENGQTETNKRLTTLEDGQEQIKLRLDNVAYRFEVTELNVRVGRIEHKLGLI